LNLPAIQDLPIPPLPIEIPLLLHPAVAHFAIAIPVVILLLEVINNFLKRRSVSVVSLLLIVLTMIIFVGLFLTGKKDGSEAYALLNEVAQADFKEHKLLGLYLIYATAGIFVLKLLSMLKIGFFRFLFIVGLLGFIGVNMLQGKKGGDLVYTHGINITAVSNAGETIDDLNDEIEELQEEIDTLKEKLTCSEVQESVDAVLAEGDVVDVNLSNQEEIVTPTKEETATIEETAAVQAVKSIVDKVSDSVESNISAVE